MSNFRSNHDDGELTEAELRRLINETVIAQMKVIYDDHLAAYWAGKNKYDEQQAREKAKLGEKYVAPREKYPAYDPSQLHEIRAIITEDVRKIVMNMLTFPLDGKKPEDESGE